jgi:hypothetical protein
MSALDPGSLGTCWRLAVRVTGLQGGHYPDRGQRTSVRAGQSLPGLSTISLRPKGMRAKLNPACEPRLKSLVSSGPGS